MRQEAQGNLHALSSEIRDLNKDFIQEQQSKLVSIQLQVDAGVSRGVEAATGADDSINGATYNMSTTDESMDTTVELKEHSPTQSTGDEVISCRHLDTTVF